MLKLLLVIKAFVKSSYVWPKLSASLFVKQRNPNANTIMTKYFSLFAAFAILLLVSSQKLRSQTAMAEAVFPGIFVPQVLGLKHTGDGSTYLYAVSQQGQVYRFDRLAANPQVELWLDISDRLVSGGERGLLGLAFHPDFSNNGKFYVNYTAPSPLRTTVSSFETNATGEALPDSETVLLQFNQPFTNHNGGDIAFGPDGYLYISSGDGGSGGDPQNNAQNTQNLLGAMLRIDVDNTEGGLNYAIPADNPFAGSSEGRDEIFAWGLRNPWRISFDAQTGALWIGDVGQNAWEWIHIIENGKNYGWRIIEGSHCYNPPVNCDTTGLEMPIFEYSHDNGDRSITGGFVYYGTKNPAIYGKYIYGDFVSGRIWALDYDYASGEVSSNTELLNLPNNVSSFGLDDEGEIYVLTYGNGTILSLLVSPAAPEITEPQNGAAVPNTHTISWAVGPVVDLYRLQISQSPFFEDIIVDETTSEGSMEITLENGNYFVRVSATNAAGSSGFSQVTPYQVTGTTGIENSHESRLNLALYPNPASSELVLDMQLQRNSSFKMTIYNLDGKAVIIEELHLNAGEQRIILPIGVLPNGLYVLHLADGSETVSRVFGVER